MENKEQPAAQSQAISTKNRGAGAKLALLLFGVAALVAGGLAIAVIADPSLIVRPEKSPNYPLLKTGGTSVVSVMVDNQWRSQYEKEKNVRIEYESVGSSKGVEEMIQKQLSIAFTHAPISAEQRNKASLAGGEVVQIPILLCSVAPVYNLSRLKGKKPLNFTGEVLGKIFLGTIKNWNDSELKAINTDVELPATPITVVHRAESSGTTLIFTDYLSKASKQWAQKFPRGASEITWPAGKGVERNMNLATEVSRTEGAIGYVDLLYTRFQDFELESGAIQNADGTAFIRPTSETMAAAGDVALPEVKDDLVLNVLNKPGAKSYPITGVIYAMCYQVQPESTRSLVVDFMLWASREGQKSVAKMSYAPLPGGLIDRVDQKLKSIH